MNASNPVILKQHGIKLVKRSGSHLTYDTPQGTIWVNKSNGAYVPDYYIRKGDTAIKSFYRRNYKTSTDAILSATSKAQYINSTIKI
jgi:predicted RNA binding protein YcfA (HicA-like mRNA interferase family)